MWTFERPTRHDGAKIWRLVQSCPPLDLNSCYAYMLLAEHFAETCVVARAGAELVGFISAYRPPERGETLFVWQVAVGADARGQGLAGRMLSELLAREGCAGVRYLETTVSPSNQPSAALFQSLARRLGAPLRTETLFAAELFAGSGHEAEILHRIGPFA